MTLTVEQRRRLKLAERAVFDALNLKGKSKPQNWRIATKLNAAFVHLNAVTDIKGELHTLTKRLALRVLRMKKQYEGMGK